MHIDKLVVKYVLLNYLKDQSEEWDKFILDKDVRFLARLAAEAVVVKSMRARHGGERSNGKVPLHKVVKLFSS